MKTRMSFRMVPLFGLFAAASTVLIPLREPDWELGPLKWVFPLAGFVICALLVLLIRALWSMGVYETAIGYHQRDGGFHPEVTLEEGERFAVGRFNIRVVQANGISRGTKYHRFLFSRRDWEQLEKWFPKAT